MDNFIIIKIFFLTTFSFVVAILMTPVLTHFLYKYKIGKNIRDSHVAPIFSRFHQKKAGTPTMGGILIWGSVLIVSLLFFYMGKYFNHIWSDFNFLSRSETLLPLGVLIASAIVGLIDDIFDVWKMGQHGGGLKVAHRLIIYTLIAAVGAWWFYFKLDWTTLHVPFVGNFDIMF